MRLLIPASQAFLSRAQGNRVDQDVTNECALDNQNIHICIIFYRKCQA
jgi:hypothetical protein